MLNRKGRRALARASAGRSGERRETTPKLSLGLDALVNFNKACHGVIEWAIFGSQNMAGVLDMLEKERCNDPSAIARMKAVAGILKLSKQARRGEGLVCLGCDSEFHSETRWPTNIVTYQPFGHATQVLASGICEACSRGDVEALVLKRLQEMYPNSYEMPHPRVQ
jgi:hypothetical protein